MIQSIRKQYRIGFYIFFISFILLWLINITAQKTESSFLYEILHICTIYDESDTTKWLTSTRGKNYFTISEKKTNESEEEKEKHEKNSKYCLVAFWAITHIGLYTLIGFFCPNLFIETFIVGALFELGEKMFYNCHDALDVIYNSIGFGIGYLIHKYVKL